VTTEAGEVFRGYIDGEAHKLAGRIDYRAVQSQNGGHIPPQTAEAVREEIKDFESARGDRGDQGERIALAEILVTIALTGLAIMGNFLSHSTWQLITFIGFAIIGSVGLILTWRVRRSQVRRRNGRHR
jgi:hypothetical protein